MSEVTIKSHTRITKNGKVIKVQGYSRKVGKRKAVSGKRSKKEPGKELEEKVQQKEQTQQTQQKEQQASQIGPYYEENQKSLQEYYDRLRYGRKKPSSPTPQQVPQGQKKPKKKPFMDRVEDKIANFIDKYSGKKYKRYL